MSRGDRREGVYPPSYAVKPDMYTEFNPNGRIEKRPYLTNGLNKTRVRFDLLEKGQLMNL